MQVSGCGGEGGGGDGDGGILPGGLGRVLALAGTAASVVIGTGGEGTAEGLEITDVETQQRNFENVVRALGVDPVAANRIVDTVDDDLNVGRAVAYRFATLAIQDRNDELIANAPLIYRDIRARLRLQGIEEGGAEGVLDRFTQIVAEEGGAQTYTNLGVPEFRVSNPLAEAQAAENLGLPPGQPLPDTPEARTVTASTDY